MLPPLIELLIPGGPAPRGATAAAAAAAPTATPRPSATEPPNASAVALPAAVEATEMSPPADTCRASA